MPRTLRALGWLEVEVEQRDTEESRRAQMSAHIKETLVAALSGFQVDGAVSALVKEREELAKIRLELRMASQVQTRLRAGEEQRAKIIKALERAAVEEKGA